MTTRCKSKLTRLVVGLGLGAALLPALACACESALGGEGGAEAAEFITSFAGRELAPNETLSITFAIAPQWGDRQTADQSADQSTGQFAVLIGTEDVTAYFHWVTPTRLEGAFTTLPLRPGEQTLTVHRLGANREWLPLAKTTLTVAAPPAGPAGTVKPTLIVGAKSLLAQSHSGAAQPPARPTYTDTTLQTGLQTQHGGDGWSLASQFNAVGSSYRPETLAFAGLGEESPKLDLANYLVQASLTQGERSSGLSLGHIQAGYHPLLASGLSQRGLLLSHRFGQRYDIAASVQAGSDSVGGRQLLAIGEPEHRMSTLAANVELMERPGALRLGTTVFDGAVRPHTAPGVANLQEAERSRGWGVQLQSQTEGGGLRGELAFAHSLFNPAGDPALLIAPGRAVAGNTWRARAEADLLRSASSQAQAATPPPTLRLDVQSEYAAADYKSLGAAGVAANHVQHTLGLSGSRGLVTSRLQWSRRSDNVNNDIAFPKINADTLTFSAGAPLGQMIDAAKAPAWAPTLGFDYSRTRSAADPGHVPSGQTLADLPEVVATTQGLNLSWVVRSLNLGYRYSHSLQDNRQPAFVGDDVSTSGHGLTASYTMGESLTLGGAVDAQRSRQTSAALPSGSLTHNTGAQFNLSYLWAPQVTLSANLSAAWVRDSQHLADSRSRQLQLQLLKAFELTSFGLKLPGQWSLRYGESRNGAQGLAVRQQALNAALSLSFF